MIATGIIDNKSVQISRHTLSILPLALLGGEKRNNKAHPIAHFTIIITLLKPKSFLNKLPYATSMPQF